MDQKKLSLWLKALIAGCALCGIVLFGFLLPAWLNDLAADNPGLSGWAWTAFMWIAAIPCFGVLGCAGRIAGEIGRNNSFSLINARMLKYVAVLAAGDVGFLILGNGVFAILGMNLPLLVLISAFVCFVGLAISVAAACLSHLVLKAAKLQEDSDLTI